MPRINRGSELPVQTQAGQTPRSGNNRTIQSEFAPVESCLPISNQINHPNTRNADPADPQEAHIQCNNSIVNPRNLARVGENTKRNLHPHPNF